MLPPVVEKINTFNAIGCAKVIALGFALTFGECECEMGAGPTWSDEGSNATTKKTLYLANPYGFSAQQREGPLPALEGGA